MFVLELFEWPSPGRARELRVKSKELSRAILVKLTADMCLKPKKRATEREKERKREQNYSFGIV